MRPVGVFGTAARTAPSSGPLSRPCDSPASPRSRGPSSIALALRPALLRPAGEVVVDRRDAGLDGRPQRPADVGHDHLEPHPGEEGGGGLAEVRRAQLCAAGRRRSRAPGRVARARTSGRCCRCTRSRRSTAARRRRGSCRRAGRCGTARSASGWIGERRLDPRDQVPGARDSRPGSGCRARRRAPGSAPTSRNMSKSSRKRGPAWSRRSASAIRAGMPGAPNASFDIVRPASHSRTKTSHSGNVVERRAARRRPRRPRACCAARSRDRRRAAPWRPRGSGRSIGVPSTSTR